MEVRLGLRLRNDRQDGHPIAPPEVVMGLAQPMRCEQGGGPWLLSGLGAPLNGWQGEPSGFLKSIRRLFEYRQLPPVDVKMTKLGFLRLSYEKQDTLLKLLILSMAAVLSFSTRLFAVLRFESVIHEFDPYFNYRTTRFLAEEGFYKFHNWFDDRAWYPLGRIIGGTIYPGLMITSAAIYHVLHFFHITIDIRNVCVFLAPLFSSFTTIVTYHLTKELKVSSWGGYVFLINLIPLHVLVLMLTGRFSHRIYVAYCTVYCLGTILSMQISFVGFQPVLSSEHMAAFGVFGLCQIHAFVDYLRSKLNPQQFEVLFRSVISLVGFVLLTVGALLMLTGKISPWTGRFYSLLDPSYAKNNIPIIASVSEHQPTTWSSYYFDLQLLVFMFPVGLYYCFSNLSDARIFIIMYGVTSMYFSAVMVRLMLVLAPVMCILSGIGVSQVLSTYMKNLDISRPDKKSKKQQDSTYPIKNEVASGMILVMAFFLITYTFHSTWVTSEAYSSPSIVLSARGGDGSRIIFDDFREAYYWLRHNTPEDAKVMSWWDYGYQITAMANRTILVDNNTWNNTHISRVGQAMASTEEKAYEIMRELDVSYVLVIFGGLTGYSSDDINKFLWMVRIGGSTDTGRHIKENDYYTPTGEFRVDREGSPVLLNCLMYKMCYYRFGQVYTEAKRPPGFDRVRNAEIGNKDFELDVLEEAYTTEHWLVRIYKVKDLDNRGFGASLEQRKASSGAHSRCHFTLGLRSTLIKALNTKLVCECLGLGRASARKDSLFRVGLLKLLFCRARDRTTRAGPLYGKGVRVCDRMMQASFGGKSSAFGFPWQLAKDCLLRRAPRTVEEDSREGLRAAVLGAMAVPFVEDWDLVQTLGEGAYGEVQLAVNRITEEAVAVKIVDMKRAIDCPENIKKEICINKMLNHENVVKFYGHRREGNIQYLFLEYCSGGELFDRIDNLKISDFGLATVFRHNNRERLLNKMCGTLPYVAPELLKRKEFHAEPVDVWSCGIVLTAMLAGGAKRPRATSGGMSESFSKHIHSNLDFPPVNSASSEENVKYSSSQPEPPTGLSLWDTGSSYVDKLVQGISFSQPTCPDHMLVNSQLLGTPGSSQNPWQRLVKRMTRFFTKLDADKSYQCLKETFEKLGYQWKKSCMNQVTVSTTDRRNNKLIFKINLVEMDEKILVDFRLSKLPRQPTVHPPLQSFLLKLVQLKILLKTVRLAVLNLRLKCARPNSALL
ncbi:Dolichyl-diphosphooligosaccharide--protein glycosyltransferase subunit STT3A [Microtus ochrogaster]|uniref:Dolichyl-diphosphooligosaccharide--protein glycosyltransferase subunit STT3A n=3 Tax=Rodentia TaxID=9989 RepID=A0A8J6L1W4_MICOH|nr:Dolichyl-diphosphooligosaccharide--protein glycosyltransferase subunit STT3A [Microtus ochrogaster]